MDKLLIKELCSKIMDNKDRKQFSYSDYLKRGVTIEEIVSKVLVDLGEINDCDYCSNGKMIPNTTGGNRWYINTCKNELQADNDNIAVESIKINYCPMCGRKII